LLATQQRIGCVGAYGYSLKFNKKAMAVCPESDKIAMVKRNFSIKN
jgi:hypothetical protein